MSPDNRISPDVSISSDKANPALDLMTFLLTKKFGSEEEAQRRIRDFNSNYENKTVGAFALCISEGIDVPGALDQIQEVLKEEGLLPEATVTVDPEQGIPCVMTNGELNAFINKNLPRWRRELGVKTEREQS